MAIAALILVGSLGYLLIHALGGAELGKPVKPGVIVRADRHTAWPWLLLGLLAGLSGLAGWALSRRAAGRLAADHGRELESSRSELERSEGELEGAREEADEQRDHAARAEKDAQQRRQELKEREQELARSRAQATRANELRQLERSWNHELRSEVVGLQRAAGALGDPADVRSLVLRLTVRLVQAEKGLLLTHRPGQEDRDVASDLDVAATEGFEHDPADSQLVERFAARVLQADEMVREDEVADLAEGEATAADREIQNLVAIPIYVQDEFSGVVVCANREGGFEELDDDVLLSLGDHAGAILDNHRLHGELRSSYVGTVRVLTEAIGAKDAALRSHSEEVLSYVTAVADRLELASGEREELLFGSLLHDVGKIGISEQILLKPGRLTPEEFAVIRLHPRIGLRLVEQVPALRNVGPAVLHHHERFDGTGYPSGLTGEEIPLSARVIAVADAFSAMIESRPYREVVSTEEACHELERCAGTQFDPRMVELFVEAVRMRPASKREPGALSLVFDDPELGLRAGRDGTMLGASSFAVTDSLTQLYSHRYFHEQVESEARRAAMQERPFAVLMLKFDGLGEINEREGYAAGDAALQRAGKALQRASARAGGTPCRYSGRRLALVIPLVDEEVARQVGVEVCHELGSNGLRPRAGAAGWRPGDAGADVARRALFAADGPPVVEPAA